MIEGVIYRYKSPSGKYYIGQTISEYKRRWMFLSEKRYGGVKIDNARKKYGPENFEYTVLMKVTGDDPEEVKKHLNTLEIGFIRMYDSVEKGYNISDGGESRRGQIPWNKGKKLETPSWNKGIPMSEEQKKKLSEAHKGKPSGRKGMKLNDEWRKKLSEAHKGKPSGRKGVKLSEESRRKISESLKGRDTWNKGKHWTEEQKKKMGVPKKGRHREYNPDGTYRMVK